MRTLAVLNTQADDLRAELARLRRVAAEVRRKSSGTRATQLCEANEQLVLSALHAETVAVAAVSNLSELARSSQRDALTGTPNRTLMLDRVRTAIASARRHATRSAILFVDLDHFKLVNDSLGHGVGDEVLRLVSQRLESAIRGSDTVSRHGGDEFLVLLAEVADERGASRVAMKILAALAAPCLIGDHMVRVSASLGIAVFPDDGDEPEELISRADAAMYQAKQSGRDRFAMHGDRHSAASAALMPTAGGPQHSSVGVDLDLLRHQPSLRNLREANENLVIAALAAQELGTAAQKAHHRQIEFVAKVAHELRNPLNPMRTVVDLIKHSRNDDALAERVQVIIKSQVAYMSRLVDDLLDGARAGSGAFRLERRRLDVLETIQAAVQACRPTIEQRSQSFAVTLPQKPVFMDGDPLRLTQIFSNLLDNASKYTGTGGAITLTTTVCEVSVAVTISDNGIGITPAALPTVFDLFVQETRALPLRSGGLGIGLAIVRDLVEAHGGTVVGQSAGVDCGSAFVVTLPLLGCQTVDTT